MTSPQPLSATPAENQTIVYEGKQYTTVREGRAFILVPKASEGGTDEKGSKAPSQKGQPVQQVFYNPIQQFNRDLTVLAIKAYGKDVVGRKQEQTAQREATFNGKKRKREGQQDQNRPSKVEKVSEVDDVSNEPDQVPPTQEADLREEPASAGGAEAPKKQGGHAGQSVAKDHVSAGEQTEPSAVQDGSHSVHGKKRQLSPPKFTILDALSATGLRALRYAQEIPFVTSVTANDLDAQAVRSIKLNAEHNKLEDKIQATRGDALAHMYTIIAKALSSKDQRGNPCRSMKYDVVDLDPYGTAAPFFDAAVQAVRDDGGLLCITCTDAGVWASTGYAEKTFAIYGGVPAKGNHSHEAGLRIILHAVATSAGRYGLVIEPLLSLSIDFYARLFVRVRRSPAALKFHAGKTMVVYACDQGCGAWTTQPILKNKIANNKLASGHYYKHGQAGAPTTNSSCEHCGTHMHLAGPMYGGRIHSPEFIQKILEEVEQAPPDVYQTTQRIRGMLHTALEEFVPEPVLGEDIKLRPEEKELAAVDPCPFFFIPSSLAKVLHCQAPGLPPVRGALRRLGYQVTRSHCKPGSIKTNAPWSAIWRVMKEWSRQKAPVKAGSLKEASPGYRLLRLGQQSTGESDEAQGGMPEIVFDEKLGQDESDLKLVRYQPNPRENWGPMNRAKGKGPTITGS